ncbi:hypothetical protein K7X08_010688 [Anisodus acutangulus]|uniref:Uncharacterized protein n=1 Tax=Anisodus acutangulus TaxID=402998 RepID=A0A9Q1M280_9SOLA|nr:hypothetical protein K7X08_010688 [Anisodus acutangulus]
MPNKYFGLVVYAGKCLGRPSSVKTISAALQAASVASATSIPMSAFFKAGGGLSGSFRKVVNTAGVGIDVRGIGGGANDGGGEGGGIVGGARGGSAI